MLGVISCCVPSYRILLVAGAVTMRKDRGKTCTKSQPMSGETIASR